MRLLDEVLRRHDGLVAFIDESFELNASLPSGQFYILAGAVVEARQIKAVATGLLEVSGGFVPHASALWRANKKGELRTILDWAVRVIEECDVHVFRGLVKVETNRADMRAICLEGLLASMHSQLGVSLFVLDSSKDKNVDEDDRRTHRDLKRAGILAHDSQMFHQWPSEQPLLALPDMVCWAFRQEISQNSTDWSGGFREYTEVFEYRKSD